uniref:Uncharacterized protein n=1 Tax=Amphimedon queenslandica TaxID=400682 RepID=A0A1X7V3Z6_AMPQE
LVEKIRRWEFIDLFLSLHDPSSKSEKFLLVTGVTGHDSPISGTSSNKEEADYSIMAFSI